MYSPTLNQNAIRTFIDISEQFSLDAFEQLKAFVLEKGDRKTYRSFDNHNPHYDFDAFEVFLGADIGQENINNDPKRSGFNQLVIADWETEIRYLELICVRNGDVSAGKKWMSPGMHEGKVYLVDPYDIGLEHLLEVLPSYLERIVKELK